MNLFFELFQVALGTRDKLSRVPTAVEWGEMYDEAERQTVVGVMLGGLERLPVEQLPPVPLKLQWIGMVKMMEATYRLHGEKAVELTRKFRSVGYMSCVLKGIGTAQLYPVPSRRQCGDIDLWVVPKGSLESLKNGKVRSRALRKSLVAWLRTQCEIGHPVWHHVEAKFFEDVPVEVHVHPAWMYGPRRNRRLQRFFEHEPYEWRGVDKYGFNVPRVEFEAVFSLVHTFHHLLEEGVGLRHVVDYFYILKTLPMNGRDEAMRTLKSIGLVRFTSAMMWVLHEVCGMPASELLCEPNEKEGKFLLSEIMTGGNFGKTRQDGKVRNSLSRWLMMVKHYPSEVLWMVPWKVWHRCWRFFNMLRC
ncbi:MAG: nucleotidyltransferase family protein [Bacteroidaceae bacterium]|nr:nucleotidyltransferase family protein [Bacteroidaceae bacterium]